MRITGRQLRRIIQEEVARMMNEEDATSVDTKSLAQEIGNFIIRFTFDTDNSARHFVQNELKFENDESGTLQYRAYNDKSTGEIRITCDAFVSDDGTRIRIPKGAGEGAGPLPHGARHAAVPRLDRLAPQGMVEGQRIDLPTDLTVALEGRVAKFTFYPRVA